MGMGTRRAAIPPNAGRFSRRNKMNTQDRALEMVKQLRREGLDVARVVVEGRKYEIELAQKDAPQKLDEVKW